jgi:hypothetical protein
MLVQPVYSASAFARSRLPCVAGIPQPRRPNNSREIPHRSELKTMERFGFDFNQKSLISKGNSSSQTQKRPDNTQTGFHDFPINSEMPEFPRSKSRSLVEPALNQWELAREVGAIARMRHWQA